MNLVYIYNIVILHSLELIAAVFGSIYLIKSRNQSVRLFVVYLWVNFAIELIATYPLVLYYNNFDYSWFQWLKQSSFASNEWLYSIHSYITVIMIGLYYRRLIKTINYRQIISGLIMFYCVFAVSYNILKTKVDFLQDLNYFIEEIVVVSCTVFYLFELFKSQKALEFYRSVHFFIAIGLFVWYMCVMPVFLFSDFFTEVNTLYVNFRVFTLLTFNVILYSCYILGFYFGLHNLKALVKSR